MEYNLEYLPSALDDILEIEESLFGFSPAAAEKVTSEIQSHTETLAKYPLMYQVHEDDDYFRSMPLSYDYRVFYHVEEETKTVRIYRVLYGMRDPKKELPSYTERL